MHKCFAYVPMTTAANRHNTVGEWVPLVGTGMLPIQLGIPPDISVIYGLSSLPLRDTTGNVEKKQSSNISKLSVGMMMLMELEQWDT